MITHGQKRDGTYQEIAVNNDGSLKHTPVKVFPANDAIANLPANATVVMTYDLGEEWAQYAWVGLTIYPQSNATGAVSLSGSDDGTTSQGWLPMSTNAEFYISSIAAGANVAKLARPRGRYVRLSVAAGAAGALGPLSRVWLAAYPN